MLVGWNFGISVWQFLCYSVVTLLFSGPFKTCCQVFEICSLIAESVLFLGVNKGSESYVVFP